MLSTAPSSGDTGIQRRGRGSDEDFDTQQRSVLIDVVNDGSDGARDSSDRVRKQKTLLSAVSAAAAAVGAAAAKRKKKTTKHGGSGTKTRNKVLFLDGVRGMASLFVVTEHSLYWNGKNLGACAVDTFFVLSSFLLTMLFYKKSDAMLAQKATFRKWLFTLADYFSKRFFRVYPLFAAVAIFVWLLPYKAQKQYFFVPKEGDYDLYKVLTFELPYRYHVFWTLPLEIAYYFMIPVFTLVTIGLGRGWWVPFVPLFIWIVNAGLKGYREHHLPLEPHLPTFVVGSMGAVIFVKIETWIKTHAFEFKRCHRLPVRLFEVAILALMLSVTFKGLFFHWWHGNPAPTTRGSQCVSIFVTLLIVIEMLLPSPLATMLEWNVLRYWGKISFSSYLLHSFVIYSDWIRSQQDAYDKFFAVFFLIALVSTVSYHLIEYPSQLLSNRISKALSVWGGLAQHGSYLPVSVTIAKVKAHADDDEDNDDRDLENDFDNQEDENETTALHKK